jgi:hypothetical protein
MILRLWGCLSSAIHPMAHTIIRMHSTQSGPQFGGWGATLAEHDYLLRPFILHEMHLAEVDFHQLLPDAPAQFPL